jgi:hypothetical protein
MGIQKTKTAPYYPQSDGLIERLFRSVKDMVFASTNTYQREWIDVLPVVEMGLRGTIQATTKVSPFELLFGRSMRLPITWMYPVVKNAAKPVQVMTAAGERQYHSEYVLRLKDQLNKLWSTVLHSTKPNTRDEKQVGKPFEIGSYVMSRILPAERGVDKPRFDGPYCVTKKLGEWTYHLTHVENGRTQVRNHHQVKRCNNVLLPSAQPQRPLTERPQSGHMLPRKRQAPDRYGFVRGGNV